MPRDEKKGDDAEDCADDLIYIDGFFENEDADEDGEDGRTDGK